MDTFDGQLDHKGVGYVWAGMPGREELKEHDRIGFLLDMDAATGTPVPPFFGRVPLPPLFFTLCERFGMTVYLNGELKGVKPDMEGPAQARLKGRLRWAADMRMFLSPCAASHCRSSGSAGRL